MSQYSKIKHPAVNFPPYRFNFCHATKSKPFRTTEIFIDLPIESIKRWNENNETAITEGKQLAEILYNTLPSSTFESMLREIRTLQDRNKK